MVNHMWQIALVAGCFACIPLSGCGTTGPIYRPLLSTADVAQIADAEARRAQYNPVNFQRQTPHYDEANDMWDVIYWNTNNQLIQFSVHVHDKTKKTSIMINDYF